MHYQRVDIETLRDLLQEVEIRASADLGPLVVHYGYHEERGELLVVSNAAGQCEQAVVWLSLDE
jgi:hypothetical protein